MLHCVQKLHCRARRSESSLSTTKPRGYHSSFSQFRLHLRTRCRQDHPPRAAVFSCSRLNRGAPASLPGPCQTPPRYGVTSISCLRRLGGLGGILGQTCAAAGHVQSQFGPSASHVCTCGDSPVSCVICPALDPCRAYPRARRAQLAAVRVELAAAPECHLKRFAPI
jgi:hypothetical protein